MPLYVNAGGLRTIVGARTTSLLLGVVPSLALSQSLPPAEPAALAPVTVTATRIETPSFDIPASIDRVGSDAIGEGRGRINISESLGGVPGLQARDRQNYAQDVQISVRGFGARSTFGIRGVRLYVDGIPATFPDGQGQISHVDLGSTERIEVLRGPYSALYGNSSGGVISVFTEEGAAKPVVDFSMAGGSNGQLRIGTKLSGTAGKLGYLLSGSHFRTDGYRDHSAAERNIGNLKLKLQLDPASALTLIANSVDLSTAQDPLGLTRAQYAANPQAVDPAALQFDTRKTVAQAQAGLIFERRIDASNTLRALVYSGHRATTQFQSIPVATQANPLHPGGVIDLSSRYSGADVRWTFRAALASLPFSVVAGVAYDRLVQDRRGFQNFATIDGSTVLGIQGALRRDETDKADNLDEYVQGTLQLSKDWSVSAGLRHSSVRVNSGDHFITGVNGDDSGSAAYSATLPVVGILYALSDSVHVYGTAGRGFETPTLNELAYVPSGTPGLNFGLQPSRSDNLEIGLKTRSDRFGDLNVAVFSTRTDREIVTLSNVGGRSTYQNAGSTRRQGAELGWSKAFAESLRAQVALTWLDATYRDAFKACSGTPCTAATQQTVPAGNAIPGVAARTAWASLAWMPPTGWRAAVDGRYTSRVQVNDANSDAAAGFAALGASVGYAASIGPWALGAFVRADNLLDRRYAGSVIVNEGNARFFEPAPGRTWLVGASAALSF